MNSILFFSEKLSIYLKSNIWDDTMIIDYFDIETQKILPVLNYSFKANPNLIKDYKAYKNIKIDKIINLDQPLKMLLPSTENLFFPGVAFNCFE